MLRDAQPRAKRKLRLNCFMQIEEMSNQYIIAKRSPIGAQQSTDSIKRYWKKLLIAALLKGWQLARL